MTIPEPTIRPFKTVDGHELNMHIFDSRNGAKGARRPAIVFFFGGGWRKGTPAQFYPHCRYLATRGMVAAAAEYRVHSVHGTTPVECVRDGKSAVRWMREQAGELGIDPKRLAAGGGSAGGHVAATTALIEEFDDESPEVSSRPDALALFNPVLDTSETGYVSEVMGENAQRLSPLHHVKPGAPPTIVFHGVADTTVPYASAMAFENAMSKHGNDCALHGYEGKGHGFFNFGRNENIAFVDTVTETDRFLSGLGWLDGAPSVEAFVSELEKTKG